MYVILKPSPSLKFAVRDSYIYNRRCYVEFDDDDDEVFHKDNLNEAFAKMMGE